MTYLFVLPFVILYMFHTNSTKRLHSFITNVSFILVITLANLIIMYCYYLYTYFMYFVHFNIII